MWGMRLALARCNGALHVLAVRCDGIPFVSIGASSSEGPMMIDIPPQSTVASVRQTDPSAGSAAQGIAHRGQFMIDRYRPATAYIGA
jgi:hypothetical protein